MLDIDKIKERAAEARSFQNARTARTLCDDIDALLAEREEMFERLKFVVGKACYDDGELDSHSLSAYADALRFLGKNGVVEITTDRGNRVIAKWKGGKNA